MSRRREKREGRAAEKEQQSVCLCLSEGAPEIRGVPLQRGFTSLFLPLCSFPPHSSKAPSSSSAAASETSTYKANRLMPPALIFSILTLVTSGCFCQSEPQIPPAGNETLGDRRA